MKKQDHPLRQKLQRNRTLRRLENQGFIRGDSKGKTMNVTAWTLFYCLEKQFRDLEAEWSIYYAQQNFPSLKQGHLIELKQKVADVRNVAGCLFLKLMEETRK